MTPTHFVRCPSKCRKMIDPKKGHACGESAEEELIRHLSYVCTIAERLGPNVPAVHREEALYMLKGTVKEAREVIERYRAEARDSAKGGS